MQRHLIRLNGVEKINGGNFGELHITGVGKVYDKVTASNVSISGVGRIIGDVEADKLTISGIGRVKGDVSAAEFHCEGVFTVHGLLNAELVEININGFGYAGEIGGERL